MKIKIIKQFKFVLDFLTMPSVGHLYETLQKPPIGIYLFTAIEIATFRCVFILVPE